MICRLTPEYTCEKAVSNSKRCIYPSVHNMTVYKTNNSCAHQQAIGLKCFVFLCVYIGLLLGFLKRIKHISATWMDLKHTHKYMISLECGIKKIIQMISDSDVEDRLTVTSGKRGGSSKLEAWDG